MHCHIQADVKSSNGDPDELACIQDHRFCNVNHKHKPPHPMMKRMVNEFLSLFIHPTHNEWSYTSQSPNPNDIQRYWNFRDKKLKELSKWENNIRKTLGWRKSLLMYNIWKFIENNYEDYELYEYKKTFMKLIITQRLTSKKTIDEK